METVQLAVDIMQLVTNAAIILLLMIIVNAT